MTNNYSDAELLYLFNHAFSLTAWTRFLIDALGATDLYNPPRPIQLPPAESDRGTSASALGSLKTPDGYLIGLLHYQTPSPATRRSSLRALVAPLLKYNYDAALVVFSSTSSSAWRLSFICDLSQKLHTPPKRFSFLFGDPSHGYHTPVTRFRDLQASRANSTASFAALHTAFSVETLTKDFYRELFSWYLWAIDPKTNVHFPNDPSTHLDNRDHLEQHLIRLITRLMFSWFLHQKTHNDKNHTSLIPDWIFNPDTLKKDYLASFDPTSTTDGTYYNAILQNLFFATLNKPVTERTFAGNSSGHKSGDKADKEYDLKTVFRDNNKKSFFKCSHEQIINAFKPVPFLNGGLFECLDKFSDKHHKVIYSDGFSRVDDIEKRAFLPNALFFAPEQTVKVKTIDASGKKTSSPIKVSGLINILSRYVFTVEENTPLDADIALDPELLGRVFENLLGAYNPETRETARNATGSFYTPREIVDYMVNESILQALSKHAPKDIPQNAIDNLFNNDQPLSLDKDTSSKLVKHIKALRILDPACGSGAFPMGILNRMLSLLQRLQGKPETQKSTYNLKLYLIENCIYGADIQPIAVQISKLRFFISLICEATPNDSLQNYGIDPLPNLETKFVAANSLRSLKPIPAHKIHQDDLFDETEKLTKYKDELKTIRHNHFNAKSAADKKKCRQADKICRDQIIQYLKNTLHYDAKDSTRLVSWNPYDQNEAADFFDPEWMFNFKSGFDIVLGNPPYIQLQKNHGELAKLYETCHFQTFEKTGDIYCLFYERATQLLSKSGILAFITSNKWMRAGYGEKLRTFLASHTNPKLLIDFAGEQIFESATVDTNILLAESAADNQGKTAAVIANKNCRDDLPKFVHEHQNSCAFTSGDSWVILNPLEQSIKQKIESIGTPLKNWDVQINYGIKTGLNEAFIITEETRNEILKNCRDKDERSRTEKLLRPVLRGRDIKRYSYDWAHLYLVWVPWHFPLHLDPSIEGASKKAEQAFKSQYPALYAHLLKYKKDLSSRNKAETGIRYEWYALQRWGADYWREFDKPKIIYGEIQTDHPEEGYPFPSYTFDEIQSIPMNTAYSMSSETVDLHYLLGVLNSSVGRLIAHQNVVQLSSRQYRMLAQYVETFRIPDKPGEIEKAISKLVQRRLKTNDTSIDQEIDALVYKLYGLTREEADYIAALDS